LDFHFSWSFFFYFFFRIYKDIFVLLKFFRVIFVFLLALGRTSAFFGSLEGNIDTIDSLRGTLTMKW